MIGAIRQTAKWIAGTTCTAGGAIGFSEGLKIVQRDSQMASRDLMDKALYTAVPLVGCTLEGVLLSPVLVPMKIQEVYDRAMSNWPK